MATRRYHKKRVARKSRKSGKVGRKSRRVRRIRGGKLIKDTNPFSFDQNTEIDKQFASLHGVIRTKTSKLIGIVKKLYSIEISGDSMIWHPLAFNTSQNLARASIGLQNVFKSVKSAVSGNTSEAEEYPAALFVKNLKSIYSGLNIDNNFDKLSKAPLGDVTLEFDKITIKDNNTIFKNGETVYEVSGENNSIDLFKQNVVSFYKTGDVTTD